MTPRKRAELEHRPPALPGELNYVITKLCCEYALGGPLNYEVINDVIGALEGAKMEFYRRIVAVYEDQKKEENGDVYY